MKVTVIMVALNEPYVQRTAEDILEKTGDELEEIIVIDDYSDDPISFDLPKTRIIRNPRRLGLIRCRNNGSQMAKSDIVVSVDAHVKMSENWLPPLTKMVEDDYKCIGVPLTKSLNPEEWKENPGASRKAGWHWNLDFYWREDNSTDTTPMFSGHCLAFSKQWWEESGGFDMGMDQWGGENIEFSLRTWLCGGSIRISEDSWCAHWFRKAFQNYKVSGAALLRNKTRIAEVWFDEPYKSYFYDAIGRQPGAINFGDIRERQAIRERLQVKDLDWFLHTLQPELCNIYKLKDKFAGKKFAILGAGPSMNYIDWDAVRNRFDVIIGVNYIGLKYPCDYVLFHDAKPALDVLNSGQYKPDQLMVPIRMQGGVRRWSRDFNPDWCIYKFGAQDQDKPLKKKGSPFFKHATSAHTAAHVAAFMGAGSVTMFGCDGKLVDGQSHTDIVSNYREGNYWNPTDKTTLNFLNHIGKGHAMLDEAFKKWGVPLMRIGYV
jgi:glycosyltransferase involved in cell wall biosynthesis